MKEERTNLISKIKVLKLEKKIVILLYNILNIQIHRHFNLKYLQKKILCYCILSYLGFSKNNL